MRCFPPVKGRHPPITDNHRCSAPARRGQKRHGGIIGIHGILSVCNAAASSPANVKQHRFRHLSVDSRGMIVAQKTRHARCAVMRERGERISKKMSRMFPQDERSQKTAACSCNADWQNHLQVRGQFFIFLSYCFRHSIRQFDSSAVSSVLPAVPALKPIAPANSAHALINFATRRGH